MGLLLLMGDSGYNVRSELFGAGEQGAWYDPSDFSTMWQDAAGDTPVTASGDPVGLILDKSRSGPSMGTNQITNGGFSADSDWTKGTGWSIGSGVATKSAGSASVLSQAQTMTAGRYYIVTYTITRSAGSITPQFAGGSTVSGTARSSSGTFTDIMTAVSGNNTVQFSADASFAGTVDNVSVKVLSAGNHAYQVTSGARPTLNISGGLSALSFDGSDDFLRTNTIDFTATSQVTILAGARRLSDAAAGLFCELSADVNTAANRGFAVFFPESASTTITALLRGDAGYSQKRFVDASQPTTGVWTFGLDKSLSSGEIAVVRKNGADVSTTQPNNANNTDAFGNQPLFLGRRGGLSLPFTGLIYQYILRGTETVAAKRTPAERFLGLKSGVTI